MIDEGLLRAGLEDFQNAGALAYKQLGADLWRITLVGEEIVCNNYGADMMLRGMKAMLRFTGQSLNLL